MRTGKAVMIATYHADCDTRVRRTIPVVAELTDGLDVFWDGNYSGHQYLNYDTSFDVNEHYIDENIGRFKKYRPWNSALKMFDKIHMLEPKMVYIHSSGIEGLIIAKMVKCENPEIIVIFDYHDSLSYELYYQLKKIKLGWTFKYFWKIYKKFLRHLSAHVDGVVGISNTQVEQFKNTASREIYTVVVPNIRLFDEFVEKKRFSKYENGISFLWVGQVMSGRDLEKVAEWIENYNFETKLHVFGNIINQNYVLKLRKRLGEIVVFHGEFASDSCIYEKISGKVIGVFLGWYDPHSTGINSLASPNKVYSYINLELPVIVCSRLKEITTVLEEYNAGIGVNDNPGFNEAATLISKNYEKFNNGAIMLKKHYREINPETILNEFLKLALSGKGKIYEK